jgi:hypothetical protein
MPAQLRRRQNLAALRRAKSPLGLLNSGFEGSFCNLIELGSFMNKITLLKQNCVQVTGYSSSHLNAIDRFNTSDEIAGLLNWFTLGTDPIVAKQDGQSEHQQARQTKDSAIASLGIGSVRRLVRDHVDRSSSSIPHRRQNEH